MAKTSSQRGREFREKIRNGHTPKKINRKGEGLSKSELRLRRDYGISQEDYEQMYDKQEGCCAICGDFYDKLFVDHDHGTGVVRKLLCPQCNFGLGSFRDSPERLRKAAAYLVDSKMDLDVRMLLNNQQLGSLL